MTRSVLLASCGAPLALLLAGAAAAQEARPCGPDPDPRTLPAAETLADAGSVLRAAGDAPGVAVFTVGFQADGSPGRIALLESDLPEPARAAALQALAASVRPQARAREDWSVRLRLRAGGGVEVERSVECPPVMEVTQRPAIVRATVVTTVPANQVAQPPRALRAPRVRLLVDEDGRVQRVVMVEGSGNVDVDRQVEESYRTARFQPGRRDGVPARMWFDVPRIVP